MILTREIKRNVRIDLLCYVSLFIEALVKRSQN
jgi:hypothetical protein